MVDENGNFASFIALLVGVAATLLTGITILQIPQTTWADLGDSIVETVGSIGKTISDVISKVTTKKKTKVDTKVETETKTKTKEKNRYNYRVAELNNGNVEIGKPITYIEALTRVKMGKNVMCKNQMAAYKIVKDYPKRIIDTKHGGHGYYYHYHINTNHGAPHIWFQGIPNLPWEQDRFN